MHMYIHIWVKFEDKKLIIFNKESVLFLLICLYHQMLKDICNDDQIWVLYIYDTSIFKGIIENFPQAL